MLTRCQLSYRAEVALQTALAVPPGMPVMGAEIEFKEVPYFLVSRSRTNWNPEAQGDINVIQLVNVMEEGLVVDPQVADGPCRLTLIPWTNILSLSVLYETDGQTADSN